jgi:hypothetical protein
LYHAEVSALVVLPALCCSLLLGPLRSNLFSDVAHALRVVLLPARAQSQLRRLEEQHEKKKQEVEARKRRCEFICVNRPAALPLQQQQRRVSARRGSGYRLADDRRLAGRARLAALLRVSTSHLPGSDSTVPFASALAVSIRPG